MKAVSREAPTKAERLAALRLLERLCEEERKSLAESERDSLLSEPKIVGVERVGEIACQEATRIISQIIVGKLRAPAAAMVFVESDAKKNVTLTFLTSVLGVDTAKKVWAEAPVKSSSYVAVRFGGPT